MTEDLLTQFHIPNIHVSCLHKTVNRSSLKLLDLLKVHELNLKDFNVSASGDQEFLMTGSTESLNFCANKSFDKETMVSRKYGIKIKAVSTLVKGYADSGRIYANTEADVSTKEESRNLANVTHNSELRSDWSSADEDDDSSFVDELFPKKHCIKQIAFPKWEPNLNEDKAIESKLSKKIRKEIHKQNQEKQLVTSTDSIIIIDKDICKGVACDSEKIMYKYSNNKLQNSKTSDNFKKESNIKNQNEEKGGKTPPLCIISEVFGNADDVFGENLSKYDNADISVITPKKTNDITKIKGWRRKQFFVEKPTTIEFYSNSKDRNQKSTDFNILEKGKIEFKDKEPGNIENAFMCNTLDEFLDVEAQLKVDYEIPHLYAEVGIKLTSEDLFSKPNISQEDFKEVENRYCVDLPKNNYFTVNDLEFVEGNKRKKQCEESDESREVKVMKIGNGKKKVRNASQKQVDTSKIEKEEEVNLVSSVINNESSLLNCNIISKLIGVVVYPNSFKPLHPVVQKHLHKLRSYRTKIDKNWAEFAVSAVKLKTRDRNLARKVLPVFCPGMLVEVNPSNDSIVESEIEDTVNYLVNSVSQKFLSSKDNIEILENVKSERSGMTFNQLKGFVKECRVVLKKIPNEGIFRYWCMYHNCYDCKLCGLIKAVGTSNPRLHTECFEVSENMEIGNGSFDQKIKKLLAKKLRELKFSGDTLTSIDKLKVLVPNSLELIRLNFVKQSFLTGYISVWYLQPESRSIRSRAFLTFSQTPPVPNAINIKRRGNSLTGLPKVIKEIVSTDNMFDNSDFAILHCNGHLWEIHGSVNVAVGQGGRSGCKTMKKNPEVEVEQVYSSVRLLELDGIRTVSTRLLHVKAAKWWVLDISQNFDEVVFSTSSHNCVVSLKNILGFIEQKIFGFFSIKIDKGRCFGICVLKGLLPYILIGPYYFFESNQVFLRYNSVKIPFIYKDYKSFGRERTIKYFINSVITGLVDNIKEPCGLWLCDKVCVDNTCYLEAMSTTPVPLPNNQYTFAMEHGYSLSSLISSYTFGLVGGNSTGVIQSDILKTVPVYIFFDIIDLGYVTGELQSNRSIVIPHPLSPDTKIRSVRVGDLFLNILRRRITFVPQDLKIRWYVTRHPEDLRFRKPFDHLYLEGVHVLSKSGFQSVLMSNDETQELRLTEAESNHEMCRSKKIKALFVELENLKNLICQKLNGTTSMRNILKIARQEIRELHKKEELLKELKNDEISTKLRLIKKCMTLLDTVKMKDEIKMKFLKRVDEMYNKIGCLQEIDPGFKNIAEKFELGRKYIAKVENESKDEVLIIPQNKVLEAENLLKKEKHHISDDVGSSVVHGINLDNKKNNSRHSKKRSFDKFYRRRLIRKLEKRLLNLCESLHNPKKQLTDSERKVLSRKIKNASKELQCIKDNLGNPKIVSKNKRQ